MKDQETKTPKLGDYPTPKVYVKQNHGDNDIVKTVRERIANA